MDRLPKLDLARTPTPLERLPHLTRAWGGPQIWVKRDDLTGFELSGNKIRKLEYHLGAAAEANADTVITPGAIQSNHCRATALAAARLGMRCVLVLRTPDGRPPDEARGNHALHRLSGAEIEFVDPAGYAERDQVMEALAQAVTARGGRPWVIPEGASDELGMLGMADGFDELSWQLEEADVRPSAVWHAASSAGTTAGFGWSLGRSGSSLPVVAVSVGDPAEVLRAKVVDLWEAATGRFGGTRPTVEIEYRDDFLAGGYGRIHPDQPGVEAAATACTGLLFDPTYTGKALFALHEEVKGGRFSRDEHVVFWHTGGGFAALI